MEQVYTSTGTKLVHHPGVLDALKMGMAMPISLQIAPTSTCNLNCVFCSNAKRDKGESLDPEKVREFISQLWFYNTLKTVEWTGGGDPTLYEPIVDLIRWANEGGLQQGFITNGIALDNVKAVLNMLKWVRISMNCLDYVNDIEIPWMRATLGFSYVMNEKTTDATLVKLMEYARKYRPAYVRIVPNCQATYEEQERHNTELAKIVQTWGPPFFYQAKTFSRPERCWWGYVKPFLLHDGWVYPCSSVVLNEGADRQFHERYRWMRMEDFPTAYIQKAVPLQTANCSHCVFQKQNDLVDEIINPNGMENFV